MKIFQGLVTLWSGVGSACAVELFFGPAAPGAGPRGQTRRGIPARRHGTVRAFAAEGRLLSFVCDFL